MFVVFQMVKVISVPFLSGDVLLSQVWLERYWAVDPERFWPMESWWEGEAGNCIVTSSIPYVYTTFPASPLLSLLILSDFLLSCSAVRCPVGCGILIKNM